MTFPSLRKSVPILLVLFLCLFAQTARSQSTFRPQDDPTSTRENAITKSVQEISPAVVGINVTAVQEQRVGPFANDPFFRQFFENDPFYRQFMQRQKYEIQSLGSGFLISPDGYLVTNDHVVENATKVLVTMTDGTRRPAIIIGHDSNSDIALLKIDGVHLPYCKLGNSDSVLVGEWAIAFGNPFGLFEINNKPTVTVGVVSSLGMNLKMENHGSENDPSNTAGSKNYSGMIETDAVINPGNSGGPLVDANGKVIGMNTMIYTGGVSESYIGYGFAIPINRVRIIVEQLKEYGKVVRVGWIGIELRPVDEKVAKSLNMEDLSGVLVSKVEAGSPAAKAGLRSGDVILKYEDGPVRDADALQSQLDDLQPENKVVLEVIRDKKLLHLALKVGMKEINK
ncbi:MAG: trypsin-like peptidase domain-containing protein [Candidatus Kryptoniota bacterium]